MYKIIFTVDVISVRRKREREITMRGDNIDTFRCNFILGPYKVQDTVHRNRFSRGKDFDRSGDKKAPFLYFLSLSTTFLHPHLSRTQHF